MSTAPLPSGLRRNRWSLQEALVGLLLLLGLMWAWRRSASYLLPARILEGPLVQDVRADGFSLVWYTTRPTRGAIELQTDGGRTVVAATSNGNRQVASCNRLQSGQSYAYTLLADDLPLPEGNGITRTAKTRTDPLRVILFGDSGRGQQVQYQLAAQLERQLPDLIVHTGDLVYPDGARSGYRERFFLPYRKLTRQVCFWPSLGNHDIRKGNAGSYLAVFELPENGPPALPREHNYWFDAGPARFLILDSNLSAEVMMRDLSPWITETFSGCDALWRFVVFHHPPYTSGRYKPDARIQHALVPAMEHAGVDAVFCGHDHNYQRTAPLWNGRRAAADEAGIVYVVSGAGGASLYAAKAPEQRAEYVERLVDDTYSFTVLEIQGPMLHGRQVAVNGALLDEWQIEKRPATSSPGAASSETAPGS